MLSRITDIQVENWLNIFFIVSEYQFFQVFSSLRFPISRTPMLRYCLFTVCEAYPTLPQHQVLLVYVYFTCLILSWLSVIKAVRDAPFDIWGGGAQIKIEINSLSPQKLEKKFVENVGRKKKFVVEIDEKYVDQKKHQMVTYIIGKAYDKKILRRKIVVCWSPKKKVKKKVCKQQKL